MDPMSEDKTLERRAPDKRDDIQGVKFRTLAPGITTHPLVRSGRPCIEGTTIEVKTIAGLQKFHDMDAREIADHLWLQQYMVDDALAYYAAHTDYIDTQIEISRLNGIQFAEAQYGARPNSILSRRKSVSADT